MKQYGVVNPLRGVLYSSKKAKISSRLSVIKPVLKHANLLSCVNPIFFLAVIF